MVWRFIHPGCVSRCRTTPDNKRIFSDLPMARLHNLTRFPRNWNKSHFISFHLIHKKRKGAPRSLTSHTLCQLISASLCIHFTQNIVSVCAITYCIPLTLLLRSVPCSPPQEDHGPDITRIVKCGVRQVREFCLGFQITPTQWSGYDLQYGPVL